jgi:hypothetical protein
MQQSQYDPGFVAFGGGSTSSVLHPVVLAVLIVVGLLTFLLPRKYVIVPLLLGMLMIPAYQNLYIAGFHFFVYRMLILIAWVRLLASKPSSGKFLAGGFSTLDKLFLAWAICRALAEGLQFLQMSAVVGEVAFLLDALGGYFLFRSLIRDDNDVQKVVKVFAVVALVVAIGMIREQMTGHNIFGLLGGIQSAPDIRMGRIRAQGVFEHSILAGSFGATTFPLFLWLWKRGKARIASVVGAVSSTVITFACASSTPVAAWLGSIVAVCLWPVRKRMQLVRRGIVVVLVSLHLVMKAPVWYLMARVDFAGGSSGWERATLIDTCIRHVGDWWLIGTHDNANWGWDMWDQCNQFVSEAEKGGLVVLICFVAMFVVCFRKIGDARRAAEGNRRKEWLCWLLGATMFDQLMAYMGVDYFDQSKFVWYTLLAIIPAATMVTRMSVGKEPTIELLCDPTPTTPISEAADVMSYGHSSRVTASRRWFG